MKKAYEENQNSPVMVDIWGDYIDWKKRRKGENRFLVRTLEKYKCKKILDAALGDGCDSIHLLKQGFDVTSNEVDQLFLERALINAQKAGVELKITNFDWRDLDQKLERESFDAVLLQGNSLTLLFNQIDQLRAVSAFRNLLKPGGILLIDERNYRYMLLKREEILKGNFHYSRKFVYCGEKVTAKPIEIKPTKIVLKIEHQNGKAVFLTVYPFKKGELRSILRKAGFVKIKTFSDYKAGYNSKADFHQYLIKK